MSAGPPQGNPLPPPHPSGVALPPPSAAPTTALPSPWAAPTSPVALPAVPPDAVLVRPGTPSPIGAWVLLVAALAAVIGALLPWAELSVPFGRGLSVQVNGTEGDGRITLALGIVVALAAVLAFLRHYLATWAAIIALFASALLITIAIVDIVDVKRAAGDIRLVFVEVEVGSGLWLTLAAGVAGVCGAVVLLARRRRP